MKVAARSVADPVDIVLCHCEINNRYGTGILIQRMFPRHRDNVISIRSATIWGGEQEFGVRELVIPTGLSRAEIYAWTLAQTSDVTVRHVYCIPYASEEITAALALRDAHRAPFCLYVMDDQNVGSDAIPDELMGEAVEKASLRLAISSDMRDAYETKYNRRFWIAPPTKPRQAKPARRAGAPTGRGIIVGNISTQEWLEALLGAKPGSELEVDWYSNSPGGGYWLRAASLEALGAAGIRLRDPLPEHQLAARLSDYEVALLPTMPQSGRYENFEIASLSFPSRVTFLVVSSDLPIIVLGDPESYVARFVDQHGLGITCPYSGAALGEAVGLTRDKRWRRRQLASLARLRRVLASVDIANWLRESLEHGAPVDRRFEALTVQPRRFDPRYLDETPSLGPWLHDYDAVNAAFRRLAIAGYAPDFIIDAGASTGAWSHAASRVFPRARFVLIEPLYSHRNASVVTRFTGRFTDRLENIEVCECALGESDRQGFVEVEPDLLVPTRGLDSLSNELGLVGRGVIKLGTHDRELEVLRGGLHLLTTAVDIVVLQVTIDRTQLGTLSAGQAERLLRELGFSAFDEAGTRRDPDSGVLLGTDLLFVKRDNHPAWARPRIDTGDDGVPPAQAAAVLKPQILAGEG